MHAMQQEQRDAILKVLVDSENFLPAAQSSIAYAARHCVRVQLSVEWPDQYIVHRCLETLYREMRHGVKGGDPITTEFARTLAVLKSFMNVTGPKGDHLYARIAPKAKLLKAVIQMYIGILAVIRLDAYMRHGRTWWNLHFADADHSLALIGRALAAATVVELAYTLFTDGPDEVLDPLMLGISAFLIIELGKTETSISWGTGLGLLLAAIALGILFAVRQRFIEETVRVPWFWWRRIFHK